MKSTPTALQLIILANSKASKEQRFSVMLLAEPTDTVTLLPAEPLRFRKANI